MNVRRMIAFTFTFAIVALVVGLSSCERAAQILPDDTTTMPTMMDGEYPIGVIVALTGEYADPYGFSMRNGFELAREEMNASSGANITFIIEDDQSSVDGAVSAVESLVDQGVTTVVGSAISTQFKAAFPIRSQRRSRV